MSQPDHALAAWLRASMIQQAIWLKQIAVTGHRVTSNYKSAAGRYVRSSINPFLTFQSCILYYSIRLK